MCLAPVKMIKMSYNQDLTGERVVRMIYDFNLDKMKEKFPYAEFESVDVACGKCLECLAQQSREWSFRMMCEAKMYKDNCFITLTYADNPVNLVPRDLTLFLKRLRKKIHPHKIRYFACGEYGSKGRRPHYHLILFGWKPTDLEYFFSSDGNPIYKSHMLEKIWNYGFVSVGDLTLKSCKYCAKYLQKFNKLIDKDVQPFTRMSLKPGIGLDYFKQNSYTFLNTDKLYIDGEWCKIPRYFLEFSRRAYFFNCDDLKKMRQFKGKFLKINKNKINFQAKHLTYL